MYIIPSLKRPAFIFHLLLLVYFLKCTHLTLGQLSPNVIRIIGGIEALNKIHRTNLGLDEFKLCYSLSRGTYGFNLRTTCTAPNLVLALPDSHKGSDKAAIILTGDVDPNPTKKPVPWKASRLGLSFSCFVVYLLAYLSSSFIADLTHDKKICRKIQSC